jgi:hypothetical protein
MVPQEVYSACQTSKCQSMRTQLCARSNDKGSKDEKTLAENATNQITRGFDCLDDVLSRIGTFAVYTPTSSAFLGVGRYHSCHYGRLLLCGRLATCVCHAMPSLSNKLFMRCLRMRANGDGLRTHRVCCVLRCNSHHSVACLRGVRIHRDKRHSKSYSGSVMLRVSVLR